MSGGGELVVGDGAVLGGPGAVLLAALLLLPAGGGALLLLLHAVRPRPARERVRTLALAFFVTEAVLAAAAIVTLLAGPTADLAIELSSTATSAMHLHLRLDGVSVPFLAMTALVFPLALCGGERGTGDPLRGALLLALQAAVVAVVLAADVVLFSAAWSAMIAISTLLAGAALRGRQAAAAIVGAALLTWAALRLVVAFHEASEGVWVSDFDGLARLVSPDARSMEGLACVVVVALLQLGLAPFHGWTARVAATADTGVAIVALTVTRSLGLLLLLRWALPLYAPALAQAQLYLVALAAGSLALGALSCVAERSPGRLVAGVGLVVAGVATLGALSGTAGGVLGAGLLALGHGVALAGLLLAFGAMREAGVASLDELRGLRIGASRFLRGLLVCALASVGFPGSLAFVGVLGVLAALLAGDASDRAPSLAWGVVALAAVVVCGTGVLRTMVRTAAGRGAARTSFVPLRGPWLLAGLGAVMVTSLVGGLWSSRLSAGLAADGDALAERVRRQRCYASRLAPERAIVVRTVAGCEDVGEEEAP